MDTHKKQLKKILQFHGIKNKTELLKILRNMLKTYPIGIIIENDGLLVDILSIHYYYKKVIPLAFIINTSTQYNTPVSISLTTKMVNYTIFHIAIVLIILNK